MQKLESVAVRSLVLLLWWVNFVPVIADTIPVIQADGVLVADDEVHTGDVRGAQEEPSKPA